MNDPYGVGVFLSPLALWLIVAIVAELVVVRRTREINPWLPVTFFIVTMFRLYWIGWITTLIFRDNTSDFKGDSWASEKLLFSIFIFFITAVFIPAALMMFHHVWSRRQKCGRFRTLVRLIPCGGVTYLFVSHFMMAIRFLVKINP